MYSDRNATQSVSQRRGSAGMYRPSNAAWVLPPAVRAPGVSGSGGAPGPCSPRGAGGRAAPPAAAGRSAQGGRSPAGDRPGAASARRWPGRAESEGRQPPRWAGTPALGRTAAGSARDTDGPRGPRAGGTPGAGGAGQRPAERCSESPPAEPTVRRQPGLDGDERRKREPGVALRGEIQDVPFPALPADQEVQGVLIEIGQRDLEDARALLGLHHGRQQQTGGCQDKTPHLDGIVRNPCAGLARSAWNAGFSRHSGPQGRGRFIASRAHGAQPSHPGERGPSFRPPAAGCAG